MRWESPDSSLPDSACSVAGGRGGWSRGELRALASREAGEAHVLTPPAPPAEHRSSIHSCKPGRGVGLAQWLACGKPAPQLQAPRAVLPPQRGTAVLGTPWAGVLALPLLGPFLFLDRNVLLVKWVTTPDPRPGQLGSVANVTLQVQVLVKSTPLPPSGRQPVPASLTGHFSLFLPFHSLSMENVRTNNKYTTTPQ